MLFRRIEKPGISGSAVRRSEYAERVERTLPDRQGNQRESASPDADGEELRTLYFTLKEMLDVLGLVFDEPKLSEADKETYRLYTEAKQEKDYARSDELRKTLIERGIL